MSIFPAREKVKIYDGQSDRASGVGLSQSVYGLTAQLLLLVRGACMCVVCTSTVLGAYCILRTSRL